MGDFFGGYPDSRDDEIKALKKQVQELKATQFATPRFEFDGETYDDARDGERLNKQLKRVRQLMLDGKWRTLEAISAVVEAPGASVSARLRDLRKLKFGGHFVDREHVGHGLHRYRLVTNPFEGDE